MSMLQLSHANTVVRVAPGTTPDYDVGNPLVKLMHLIEGISLAGERLWYDADRFQYLFPIRSLTLYGPQGADADILNPVSQDNKTDFQKQNVKEFVTTDVVLVRGIVSIGTWSGPFLRISYAGGPDSALGRASQRSLGEAIRVWLKINDAAATKPLRVPYNARTHRYDIEFWGYPGDDLRGMLEARTADAFDSGELVVEHALVHGDTSAFTREAVDGRKVTDVAPTDAMHPLIPLRV